MSALPGCICTAPSSGAPIPDENFWAAISNGAEKCDFQSNVPFTLVGSELNSERIRSVKIRKKIRPEDDAESSAEVYEVRGKCNENMVYG